MENQYGSRGLDVMSGVRANASLPTQGRGTQATFHSETKATPGVLDEEGRPVVRTREYVTFYIAGDRKSSMVHEIKPVYRDAFLREYNIEDAYKRWKDANTNVEFVGEGMPMAHWAAVTREQVEILRFHKIFTVEQLAQAHDGAVQNLGMGFTELREVARKWVEQARTTGTETMVRRELDNMTMENAELQKRMKQMQADMIAMQRAQQKQDAGKDEVSATSAPGAPPEPPAVQRVRVEREPKPSPAVVDSGAETLPSGFGADAGAE
jgi:hypothetical protein